MISLSKKACFLLPAMLLLAPRPAAHAQVDTTRTVLPDIAPREVEIRGPLEISFPSLQRQPLVGFNPPPRVPDVPADRQPFVESYRQASANLPTSPLQRPEPPSALTGAGYPPQRGRVEAGGGRYYSRSVFAHLGAPLSDQTALLIHLDYRGSDGHQPFDDQPDVRTPFDAVEGELGVQTTGSRWAVGGALEGFYETYEMYGTGPTQGADLIEYLARPERTGQGGAGTFRLRSVADTPVAVRLGLRFEATRFETRVTAADVAGAVPSITERRFEADLNLSGSTPAGTVWADGNVSTAGLADGLGTVTSVDGGAGLRFQAGRLLNVTIGGRFLGAYSDTDQPRDGSETARIGYASPDLRLELVPVSGLQLYAQNRPGMEPNALADVFRTNPYLVTQPALRPTLRSVDAEAGLRLFLGPVQIGLRGGFQEMPQYLFFEDAPGLYSRGFTALRYAKAQVYHAGGSLSAMLPGGLHAMVGASYREGRLPNQNDADIPYFAPVVGEATLSYSFARSRGLLQVTGHFESPRYRDRQKTREVGAYLDLDAEASYNITKLIGLVARVENISGSDNERWDNYPEAPVIVGAGLRVSW